MKREKLQTIIIFILALIVLSITLFYWKLKDAEFIYYGLLTFLISIPFIIFLVKKIKISTSLLLGLVLLVVVNLCAGGIIKINGIRLYELIPIRLFSISPEMTAIKFDQVVHAYGGAICTIVLYRLMKYSNRERAIPSAFLFFLILLAGFGAASAYEIVEFVSKSFEVNGVGEYYNTLLDLCANFIGASIASIILFKIESSQKTRINRD